MKTYVVAITVSIFLSLSVYADNFQFYYKSASSSEYVSYQSVKIYNAGNSLVFSGYTDKYGRVPINLRSGNYTCKIMYGRKEYGMSIVIDNKSDYKIIYFGSSMRPVLSRRF